MVPLPDLLQEATHLAERHLIEVALSRTHGDSQTAAQLLGISRESLALRMQRVGLGRAQGGLGDGGGVDGDTPPKLLN
jgi:DNA-binding NtrC family response regulator